MNESHEKEKDFILGQPIIKQLNLFIPDYTLQHCIYIYRVLFYFLKFLINSETISDKWQEKELARVQ